MSSIRTRPAASPDRTALPLRRRAEGRERPPTQHRRRPLAGTLPAVAGLVAAGTTAAGLLATLTGTALGTPLPPFVLAWRPSVAPALAVALAVVALGLAVAPVLLRRPRHPAAFAAAAGALALALALSISAARNGTGGWDAVFDYRRSFEAKNEYLPALPALGYGIRFFLDHFAEIAPALPVHVAGHPPGLIVVVDALGLKTPARLAALCIGATGALAPLAYVVGRTLLSEARARATALLVAFSPAAAITGVTSADAVYAALGLVAAIGLLARAWVARAAGAAALAVASFFSWALVAVAAFAVLVDLRCRGLRRGALLVALCGGVLVLFYALLYAATGFDAIGAISSTHQVYEAGIASTRPYAFWLFGSPVAFGVALGIPTALLALRAVALAEPIALALAVVVIVASVLGLTKAETERIWLFLMPLACLAAATVLPLGRLRTVLAVLAAQALATSLLFDSVW